jgi:hypothetical protein
MQKNTVNGAEKDETHLGHNVSAQLHFDASSILAINGNIEENNRILFLRHDEVQMSGEIEQKRGCRKSEKKAGAAPGKPMNTPQQPKQPLTAQRRVRTAAELSSPSSTQPFVNRQ